MTAVAGVDDVAVTIGLGDVGTRIGTVNMTAVSDVDDEAVKCGGVRCL